MNTRVLTVAIIVLCITPLVALAGPSLQITKPPVTPDLSWTGPIHDPHARRGQWFLNSSTGDPEVRTHEFYDDPTTAGGGAAGTDAIHGVVTDLYYDSLDQIEAFTLQVTITNDTPAQFFFASGDNSHGESLATLLEQYDGTMLGTKLTVEFALAAGGPTPTDWAPPVNMPSYFPHIPVAVDPDQLAWYCWTPENPDPDKTPAGDYYVPVYDFGDIAPGESATRILNFFFVLPVPSGSDLEREITEALVNQQDVLQNRTTSLKISTWLDNFSRDSEAPYFDALRGSNCSVFHSIPEPGVVVLAGLGLLALLRRRPR